jgi:hypothetical protein
MDTAPAITPSQFCPAGQPPKDLARDLHVIADHMAGTPLDAYHAVFSGSEDNLDFNAMVGRYQPPTYLISAGGIRRGGFRAA